MDRYEDGTVIVGSWTVRAGVDAAEPEARRSRDAMSSERNGCQWRQQEICVQLSEKRHT